MTSSIPASRAGSIHAASDTAPGPARSHTRMPSRVHRADKKIAAHGHPPQPGFVSDKATLALIRRVLCPHLHQARGQGQGQSQRPPALEELLPPLTHSAAVDLQLYALIAIIIQEFVLGWYANITHDRGFTDEIVRILAHCTRLLEQRLRHVDVHALLLDELPALLQLHIAALRTARQSVPPGAADSDVRNIYHTLNPHPALSPLPIETDPGSVEEQNEAENTYRHLLAQGLLANLLPTEDLENTCLRTLLGDILADLILKQVVADQLCHGWYLWQCFSKLVILVQDKRGPPKGKKDHVRRNQLERYGLLSTDTDRDKRQQSFLVGIGWLLVQYLYFAYLAVRFFMAGMIRAFSNRSSRKRQAKGPYAVASSKPAGDTVPQTRPFIDYCIFGTLALLLDIPMRMPWLCSAFSLGKHLLLDGPFEVGVADSVLDRFLHDTVQQYILTPSLLPDLLLAVRSTLFPENTRPLPPLPISPLANDIHARPNVPEHAGPSLPTNGVSQSSSASQPNTTSSPPSEIMSTPRTRAIRRECASNLLSLIPANVAFYYLCPQPKSSSHPESQFQPQTASRRAEMTSSVSDASSESYATTPDDAHGSTANPNTSKTSSSSSSGAAQETNDDARCKSRSTTTTPSSQAQDEELLTAIETDLLDVFSDTYCNKHLIYSIIEVVVVRLLPEMQQRNITELMAARGL